MRRVVRLALLCVIVTLVGVVGAESAPAQSTPRPPLQDAAVKLQAGDFEGAITVLEPLTESSPRNGQAWLMLGRARLGAGDPEGARAAYMTATELEDVGPNALYGVGMTHAVDSSLDLAFHWLERAKESGRVNMTQLGGDPNAGNLADDPRYSSLFPTDEEFSDPFREPYEIVHEWRGEAAGDQFGWIARNIGDVDADGVNDVTTSAPTHAGAGPAAGKIYVYSGESGALLWSADGEPNGQLGWGSKLQAMWTSTESPT